MFATFILILFYRYDSVIASTWIRYPVILMGEGVTPDFYNNKILSN
jgi:hypothetical protein